jgi:hypothetical protein
MNPTVDDVVREADPAKKAEMQLWMARNPEQVVRDLRPSGMEIFLQCIKYCRTEDTEQKMEKAASLIGMPVQQAKQAAAALLYFG